MKATEWLCPGCGRKFYGHPEAGWCPFCHPQPDSLDAAWSEAEAALPEGGYLSLSGPNKEGCYNVAAYSGQTVEIRPGDNHPGVTVHGGPVRMAVPIDNGYGPIPATALRALAAKLREAK